MPLYAYKCTDCGEEAEYIQKFSDPPMTECERCGGRIEKQITAAAFHLKGAGWYKDGYASAKAEGADKKAPDSAAAGSGSTPSSGEAATPGSDGKGREKKKKSEPRTSA
jgi:putative FmdB family regulatory protein